MADEASGDLGNPKGKILTLKPAASLGWLDALWLLPMIGMCVYLIIAIARSFDDYPVKGWTTSPLTPLIGICMLAIFPIMGYLSRKNKHFELVQHENGFQLRNRGRRLNLPWDRIRVIDLAYREQYAEGSVRSTTHDLAIWTRDDFKGPPATRLQAHFRIEDLERDAFLAFVDELLNRDVDRLRARLTKNEKIVSQDFTLEAGRIRFGARDVPLDHISLMSDYEGKIGIWLKDDPLPSIFLKPEGPHLRTLWRYISQEIDARPKKEDADNRGLGRVLYQRSPQKLYTILGLFVGLLGTGLGIVMLFSSEPMIGLGITVVSLLVCVGSILYLFGGVYFHQFGLLKKSAFGNRTLRYDEIGTMTYSHTRHYTNGAYTHTAIGFRFHPMPEIKKSAIAFDISVQNVEDHIDGLRNHVANIIADRMVNDLRDGKTANWTPGITMQKDGINYRAKKLIGKGDAHFARWEDVASYSMSEGVFRLNLHGGLPVLQCNASEPNFFPGFFVILLICFAEGDGEVEAEEDFED